MFDSLSERLSVVLRSLTKSSFLGEKEVDEALRQVRLAFLEADVALDVTKSFISKVREAAIGQEVLKSVTPGQQVVKIVHDALVELLGGEEGKELNLDVRPPAIVMLVGLQGSGKTTTAAKLGLRIGKSKGRKVLLASLDVQRPAAQEQLRILGEQSGIETLPIVAGQSPVGIATRALQAAKLSGVDLLILDTAGRTHIDEALMSEMAAIEKVAVPHEVLLVADAMTGQDAVNVARSFSDRVGVTGVILTRIDGDGRGGAALSMRAATGKPIRYVGVGEKLEAFELFHPARIAGRILGMGDIVGLVEKAAQDIDAAKAQALVQKMQKGKFDLSDYKEQLEQVSKLGGIGAMLGMLPGMGAMKKRLEETQMDGRVIKRQIAIISSMTPQERMEPGLLKASRKKRIAAGSGTKVEDVNRLLKVYLQTSEMMKTMSQMRRGGGLSSLAGAMGLPGGGFLSRFSGGNFPAGFPNPGTIMNQGEGKKKR